MGKEDYQDQLVIINDSVNHLLDEDLDVEVSWKLEEFGFEGTRNNQLIYSKEDVEIIYRCENGEPFSVILNGENGGKTVKVKRVLSDLLKDVIEDM